SVRLTDAMTLSHGDHLSPLRELCRKVEGLGGAVPLRWCLEPRFDYGRGRTRIGRRGVHWVADHGSEAVTLGAWGAGEPTLRADGVAARVDRRRPELGLPLQLAPGRELDA